MSNSQPRIWLYTLLIDSKTEDYLNSSGSYMVIILYNLWITEMVQ